MEFDSLSLYLIGPWLEPPNPTHLCLFGQADSLSWKAEEDDCFFVA
jgi:hypothetical protein